MSAKAKKTYMVAGTEQDWFYSPVEADSISAAVRETEAAGFESEVGLECDVYELVSKTPTRVGIRLIAEVIQ